MSTKRIEENYFAAWRERDTDLFVEMFEDVFVYESHGNSPTVMKDKVELRKYWNEFVCPQKKIEVVHKLINGTASSSIYSFYARFYSPVEGTNVELTGYAKFKLSRGGKVKSYVEDFKSSYGELPVVFYLPAKDKITFFFKRMFSLETAVKLSGYALKVYYAVLLIFIILAAYVSFSSNPLELVNGLRGCVAAVDGQETNCLKQDDFLNYIFRLLGGFGVLTFLITKLEKWMVHAGGFQKIRDTQKPAPAVLAALLLNSDKAFVFGGDFDFLGTDEALAREMRRLADKNSLFLFSSKNLSGIFKSLSYNASAVQVINNVRESGNLFEESNPDGLKMAIIQRGNSALLSAKAGDSTIVVRKFRGSNEVFSILTSLLKVHASKLD